MKIFVCMSVGARFCVGWWIPIFCIHRIDGTHEPMVNCISIFCKTFYDLDDIYDGYIDHACLLCFVFL
jgi:hypothetical protein